jgi:TetR/AcrR family transcriptional repressor of nem operon
LARPREFEIENVLERAAEVFSIKGYHATSMDELMAGIHLTKGSVYKAFKDKRDIFIAALRQYSDRHLKEIEVSLNRPGSPVEMIRRTFYEYIEKSLKSNNSKGCLLTNTAIELGAQDREISEILKQRYRSRARLFEEAVIKAQKLHEIDPVKDSAVLGNFLEMTLHGLRVLIRLGIPADTLKESIDQAMHSLE